MCLFAAKDRPHVALARERANVRSNGEVWYFRIWKSLHLTKNPHPDFPHPLPNLIDPSILELALVQVVERKYASESKKLLGFNSIAFRISMEDNQKGN